MNKKSHGSNIVNSVLKIAQPIATDLGFDIWDIKFVKEGSGYYLRIFIDSENGINIEDCEKMSRAIDKPLDELDPIAQNYCLEVCSPGVERELTKDEHFKKYIGQKIIVRLFRPIDNGSKQISGILSDFDKNELIILTADSGTLKILRKDIVSVKLDDFEN